MPGEKHFKIDDLVKKLSVNKQALEYFIKEGWLGVYLSEDEVLKFLSKKKAADEKSARQRKETEIKYQEKLNKIPKEKKYFNGKTWEL